MFHMVIDKKVGDISMNSFGIMIQMLRYKMYIQICEYIQDSIYTYIPQLCQLGGPRNSSVAMSTSSALILVANTILQSKTRAPWVLGKKFDTNTGAGNTEDEAGIFCGAHKQESAKII